MMKRPVYVVGGTRTPFAKSLTVYSDVTGQELMTACLVQMTKQFNLQNERLGDVGLGSVIHSSMDWDFARECVLGSGVSPYTPAYGVQRACASSLETTWELALKIANSDMDIAITGGVDTNSDLPITLPRSFTRKMLNVHKAKNFGDKIKGIFAFRPSDLKLQIPSVKEPRTGLSMGEHCEKMVKEWKISRQAQDELALLSQQHAEKAYAEGFYQDLVFEFHGIAKDTFIRSDTNMDLLAKLKPAFDFTGTGTLTAGNSSPLSDGAAAALLVSEVALKQYNYTPLAQFIDAEIAAIDFVKGDGLLMAPTIAVSRLLDRNNLKLQDFDFYEIHEAFAGQVLCTLKAWESDEYCQKFMGKNALGSIDRDKLNVKGGSVALGHPFGATGARIVAGLSKLLYQTKKKRGLISICTAGGMGCAAILESA
ncbi:MAG: acetyl-CoA C-acetyltransferase [Pseudomonadota bacterium]